MTMTLTTLVDLRVEDSGDEYYTPRYIIDAVRAVMEHIDLDPASSRLAQTVVQADSYFTKENDGLGQPWWGKVFLNPPFSAPKHFIMKVIEEYSRCHVTEAIVLTNNGTETEWGQKLLRRFPVCFVGYGGVKGSRISFWKTDPDEPRTGNRYAQMIFYLGKNPAQFINIFSDFGTVLQAAERHPPAR